MRIIVIADDNLIEPLFSLLNMEKLDVAAIVALSVPPQRDGHWVYNGRIIRVASYEYLNECIENLSFDCILVIGYEDEVIADLRALNIDPAQIINCRAIREQSFMRFSHNMYVATHSTEPQGIITGNKEAIYGLVPSKLSVPIINMATPCQDLYHSYSCAKKIFAARPKQYKYAFIGLSPYSLHYDLAESSDNWDALTYYPVFPDEDKHPFDLTTIFNDNFRKYYAKLQLTDLGLIDAWQLWGDSPKEQQFTANKRLQSRRISDKWLVTEQSGIVATNHKILVDYIHLCRENHVTPVLVSLPVSPVWQRYFPQKLSDEFYANINDISHRENVKFLDYQSLSEITINDFRDAEYLNQAGAEKATKRVSNLVTKLVSKKMRVGFIMQSPPTWDKTRPVYEKMLTHDDIEVFGFVIPGYEGKGSGRHGDYDPEHEYFHSIYNNVANAISPDGIFIDLESYHLDYVFYQRPYEWFRPLEMRAAHLSKFTKPCYIPYASAGNDLPMRNPDFVNALYFCFSDSIWANDIFSNLYALRQYHNQPKFLFLGYPHYEASLMEHPKRNNSQARILWAPRRDGQFSHFLEYRHNIFNLRKQHNEVDITIRFHPLLINDLLLEGKLSTAEWENYLRAMNSHNIKMDKNVLMEATIANTDILILDMSSMIFPFILQDKPAICCSAFDDLPPDFSLIGTGTYVAKNWQEVEHYVDMLLKGNDPLHKQRKKTIDKFRSVHIGAANRIIDTLLYDYKRTYSFSYE